MSFCPELLQKIITGHNISHEIMFADNNRKQCLDLNYTSFLFRAPNLDDRKQ